MRGADSRTIAVLGSQWCAVGLGFSLPISVAVDNVLLAAFVLLWFMSGDLAPRLRRVRAHPVGLMALLFGASILISIVWSSAPEEHLRDAFVDALRFVMIPLFAVTFLDPSTRDRAQFAFLFSSAIVLLLSFGTWLGIADAMPGLKGRPDFPVVFKSHITHNMFMGAAAVLYALHAMEARNRKARLFLSGLAVAATIDVFFLIPGWTGQLVLAAALACLAIVRLEWRGVALAAIAFAVLGGVIWFIPESARVPEQLIADSASAGMRLEFYRNALELIGEHPVIGVGSGGFRSAYEAKVRGTQMVVADHPHSAFLQVGVELGLVGVGVLIALLLVQWRVAGTLGSFTERTAARGLVLIFVVAGFVTSGFLDHAEGWFYAWASGLLFATAYRRDPTKP